ncbi:MAG: NUDIX domain-containing protein [Clostridiales bacterium]|nr:NUDIX domain-containing protein [Clostridiales bacterium]
MAIRSAAKALIVRGGRVLLNRCVAGDQVYYDLPGGGQRMFETLEQAVIREVAEETGYRVAIVRFAGLLEEICDSPAFRARFSDYAHRILHVFLAEVVGEGGAPSELDYQQRGSEWVPIVDADSLPMRPAPLQGRIARLVLGPSPQYLGTVRVYVDD